MSTQRVAVACPACSSDAPTAHEVLKEGGLATVRCTECGHTHKTTLSEEESVERQVVVSQDGESFTARQAFDADETLAVGDEFLVDTPEALLQVRVTDLQLAPEERTDEADAGTVQTVWTRGVGNVSVNLTLHPKGGDPDGTRSVTFPVPGDEEFVVGETVEYGGEEFTVDGFVVRDTAEGYDRDKYDYDGDAALAKDVKRLYGRDETSSAWSAW